MVIAAEKQACAAGQLEFVFQVLDAPLLSFDSHMQ